MANGSTKIFQTSDVENRGDFGTVDWALFFGIAFVWGSSFLFIAIALDGLTPGIITLGRVGLGALTLWIIRGLRGGGTPIAPSDRARVFLLSWLWVGIPFTLFPLAQEYVNSAVTGLLNGAMPIFAAIVSTVFLKAAPKGVQLAGIVIGFVGIVLVSLGSGGDGGNEALGVLMILAATVCYGFAVNVAVPLQRSYGAITLMSNMLGLATIWVIPLAFRDLGDNDPAVGTVAAVAFLGIVGTGLAYWVMATLVGRVGAIRASFATYLIPVVALVLGVIFRDDEVTALTIVGAVFTIGGALLASRRETSRVS
ncbi:MAG: DMT family transporter [Acidimicrobiales bacterium]